MTKKIFIRCIGFLLLLGFTTLAKAQTTATVSKDTTKTAAKKDSATTKKDSATAAKDTILTNIITANDLKSGNWQDVLSNFFQLAASDLTGPNKNFTFQSTIFAIKSKVDSTILVDTNYVHHKVDRNVQFSISLGLDSNYQFHGFSGGVTWAIVNKRDSTVISLAGTKADSLFKVFSGTLFSALGSYEKTFKTGVRDSAYIAAKNGIDSALKGTSFDSTRLPAAFKTFLAKNNISIVSFTDPYNRVQKLYQAALAASRVKPLLTMSLISAFTKAAGFDSAQLGLVYLQGMTRTGKSLELDLRGNFIVKDSLVGADHYRSRMDLSGGLDYALITARDSKTKTSTSILEVKPYFEYNHLFSALLTGEKRDVVYAAAQFRLRVTSNLWLPLTLKYDLSHKSFLGFLNVSFNMNSFSNSTAKKATAQPSN
jgi:hypothetical protein